MRRSLLPLLLAPLVLLTAGCGAESKATDAAHDAAKRAGQRLYGQRPRTAQEVGREAAALDGVEVLRVTGTSTHDGDGVDVVVRTSGSASAGGFGSDEVTVRRCFRLRVSSEADWDADPRQVDCPDGPALTFPAPPAPPELPYEQIEAELPRVPAGGRADEAAVRRALAALHLDPAVRTEVTTDGVRVGVLLAVPGNGFDAQDCLLARVAPGATEVWAPSRMQRMPGEGGCTVGNALDPQPAPH